MRRVTESYYNYHLQKHKRLLTQLVLSASSKPYLQDELMRVAERELLWSMIHFDSEQGQCLAAYIKARVRHKIQHFLRDEKRHTQALVCGGYIPGRATFDDRSPQILEEVLSVCDALDRAILVDHHIGGKTIREMAQERNVSRDSIWQAERRAKAKIRSRFHPSDIFP